MGAVRKKQHLMYNGQSMARWQSEMQGFLPFRMVSVLPWSTFEGCKHGLESIFSKPKTIDSGHYLNSTLGV
jgi:hypothetical protein